MEEIKKKNKKLKKIAIILFIIIILIASYCIFLYYQSEINVDYAMDVPSKKMQIQMFNAKFSEYDGFQKGTSVKALLAAVMASNNTDHNNHIVSIEIKDGTLEDNNSITNFISKIEIKNKYKVSIYDSDNDEYIDKIFIRIKGEEATEEELKLEQIKQQREEELKLIEREMGREELKERIILSVIILLVVLVSLILIIKTVKILKGNDENKKHKVLIAFVTTESIMTGGLLLVLIGIMTGIIYNF